MGVGLGAFGAHKLKTIIKEPELIQSWQTACNYHMLHAVMIGVSASLRKSKTSPLLFTLGILCFSGSIYGLVVLPKGHGLRKVLGPVTPLGGLLFMGGWFSFAFAT